MQPFPPFNVQVKVRPWHCILDGALMLSPHGLLFALRLADEMSVWLGRSLWNLLDNTDPYLADASLVAMGGMNDSGRLERVMDLWQAVRLDADISRMGMYWAGDATHESYLPDDVDKHMPWRFEQLAESLESRSGDDAGGGSFRAESARDAVALCGALVRQHPLIFTLYGEAAEPFLCAYLRQCAIPCVRQAADETMVREHLAPIFARAGTLELTWSGLRLAAVHVVAPHTVGLTAPPSEEDSLAGLHPDDSGTAVSAPDWWDDARAYWYPVC